MVNSIFGKTIQKKNTKQRDIQIVTNEKTRTKLAPSPRFKGVKHISGNLQIS